MRTYPFLKWAGGKGTLVPKIVRVLSPRFGAYREPFCGGATIFFALDSCIRKAHLSDVNAELMLTHAMLKKDVPVVIAALRTHQRKHDRACYLKIREKSAHYQDPVKLPARFIYYLNKTCYNVVSGQHRGGP